jgi:hypothetical protein
MLPRQIITYLRQNTTAAFVPQDIYNLNAAAKRLQLYGLSATGALFADLKARDTPHQTNPHLGRRTRYSICIILKVT